MGIIDDYINGLEGKDNIDPLEVARELHELHNQELSTREAKIEELNTAIAERDSTLTTKDAEITQWKAKNFDLAMQVPGVKSPAPDEGERDLSATSIDDLFKKD